MKKIIIAFAFVFALSGFAITTHAEEVPFFANGPIAPIPAGWIRIAPGVRDCPAWFPLYMGCMTPNR